MTKQAVTLGTAESTDASAAAGDYWAQARLRIVSKWVDQVDPRSVLDVGCGSGYTTTAIERPDRAVVGIDPDQEAIDRAISRESNAEFECCLASEAPGGPFDVVISMDVIEHVSPERIWPELSKRLSDDGRLIVSVPAHQWLYGIHDDRQGHRRRFSGSALSMEAFQYGRLKMKRSTHTNVAPLIPYILAQKAGFEPPEGTRGRHSTPVEWVKRAGLSLESRWPLPIGITLIAEFEPL